MTWSVAFSPNGDMLASQRRWNRAALGSGHRGPDRRTLKGHSNGGVGRVQLGRGAAGHRRLGQDVRLWDPATGAQVGEPLTGHTSGVFSIAFSPERGPAGLAGWDKTVRMWDPTSGTRWAASHRHEHRVLRSLSPGGQLLASAFEDGEVQLWASNDAPPLGHSLAGLTKVSRPPSARTETCWPPPAATRRCGCGTRPPGPRSGTPDRPHRDVEAVAFSPDGDLLATASGDETVRLWDPATGTQVGAPLTGHTGGVCVGGVQPGRAHPGHRQRRRDGAVVGPGHRRPRSASP